MADPIVDYDFSIEEIQNMKVTDLRKKLKSLSLPITGNKNELVERLQEACLSVKGGDSFENSQLSFDESQISELESTEDNGILEENALLEQDQFSSYISSSLEDNQKLSHNIENNSSSNSVIMPPKKRTFIKNTDAEAVEKKVLLNRTNAADNDIDLDFDIEERKTEPKPIIITSDIKGSSDEKIKLSLKSMSAAERLAMRAKRFNVSDSGSKTTASLRSIQSKNSKQSILSSATTPDLNVLKKRAERFGQCVSTVMQQIEQKERLLKRKSKFGSSVTVSSVALIDEQAKKRQRAERFGAL